MVIELLDVRGGKKVSDPSGEMQVKSTRENLISCIRSGRGEKKAT